MDGFTLGHFNRQLRALAVFDRLTAMDDCATGTAALMDMLDADKGLARRAPESVPAGRLEWYAATADLAGSLDLGITTGPWVQTVEAGGPPVHGHYLTVWKRDSNCRWRALFDAGISHAAPAAPEPKFEVAATFAKPGAPPPQLIADDAAGRALHDFQETVRQDGVAAGLRTYARTADFRFYTDAQPPMSLGAANRYLTASDVLGTCQESARGVATDGGDGYAAGMLNTAGRDGGHSYLQFWQFDPRVANWGLRILLIKPLPFLLSK
jgi:hypothetical protein